MFFDQLEQLAEIAKRTNFAIFALLPDDPKLQSMLRQNFPNATIVNPNEKGKIDIAEIRQLIAGTHTKQTAQRFIIINHADTILEAAQNALLKLLEEPKNHYHFLLLTSQPSLLLPTILSRGQLFVLRTNFQLDAPPQAAPEVLDLAKRLLVARPAELYQIATEITSKKDRARDFALSVTATTIELSYKSFFKTNNPKFLAKLPDFLKLHHNLRANGHVKLHIIADLC